jgi:hypothetical protein
MLLALSACGFGRYMSSSVKSARASIADTVHLVGSAFSSTLIGGRAEW